MAQYLQYTKIQKVDIILLNGQVKVILQYYHNSGKFVINTGELFCYALYLNTLDNLKQWYNTYEDENEVKRTARFNNVI